MSTKESCFFFRASKFVERAIAELMTLLKSPLSQDELNRMLPDDNQQEPDAYTTLLNTFTQRNTEALVKCTLILLNLVQCYQLLILEDIRQAKAMPWIWILPLKFYLILNCT